MLPINDYRHFPPLSSINSDRRNLNLLQIKGEAIQQKLNNVHLSKKDRSQLKNELKNITSLINSQVNLANPNPEEEQGIEHIPEERDAQPQPENVQRNPDLNSVPRDNVIEDSDSDSEAEEEQHPQPENRNSLSPVPANQQGWYNPFPIGPERLSTTQVVMIGVASTVLIATGIYFGYRYFTSTPAVSTQEKKPKITSNGTGTNPNSTNPSAKDDSKKTGESANGKSSATPIGSKYRYSWNNSNSLASAITKYASDFISSFKKNKKAYEKLKQQSFIFLNNLKYLMNKHSLEWYLKHGQISKELYCYIRSSNWNNFVNDKVESKYIPFLEEQNIIVKE